MTFQVGALMMENFLDIRWEQVQQAVPAFLTIVLIPLTYSVAYGVIAGLGSALFLYLGFLVYDLLATMLGFSSVPVAEVSDSSGAAYGLLALRTRGATAHATRAAPPLLRHADPG